MKTYKLISIFSLITVLLFSSCDTNFGEINSNPNDPATVPSSLLLGGVLRSTIDRVYDTFLAGESPLNWVQQLSKPQYNDGDLYKPRLNSIQTLWDVLYSSVIKDAQDMERLAIEEGNEQMQGVAKVTQAYAFQMLTDAFGYIPFTEVGVDGNFTPVYDSPQVVYEGIIALLTDASALLSASGSIDASQDLVYGGDAALWKKFANSLKFRAIMRASNGSGFTVGSQLQDLVNTGNLFNSNDDSAIITYLATAPNANPYYEGLVQNSRTAEWCVGQNLVQMMDGTKFGVFDNRLPIYAGQATDGEYRGLPAGISSTPATIFTDPLSLIGDYYLEPALDAYLMSYSQLLFLKAEAAEKGYITTGTAATYYADGIAASFASVGASLGNYPVGYSGGTAGLQQIAEQEYLALYMQGFEAWAEQRRTGFPVLTPAPAGVINQIPSRLSYPTDEQSDNGANLTAAISAQGADLLTTPIWWMN